MGAIGSKIVRKMRRFNVENRARRVLDREKPVPAPKYESNLRDMERALEVDPTLVEKLSKKDMALDNRLKNVYVTSTDSFIDYASMREQAEANADRPLPLDRTQPLEYEYGHKEPIRITPGRCTLRQATTFLTSHYEDPALWTSEKIANEYKLKHDVVVNILKHFKPFNVYIPDKKFNDSILTQANPTTIADGTDKEKTATKEKQISDSTT